jgi:histidinol-phosphate phosphatase family protein
MTPLSPYGETKVAVEKMLQSYSQTSGLRAISLRYFNAAGAEPGLRVGEWHEPESHLIPRLIKAILNHQAVELYGTDYPTRDGTCIRDYVYVWDLAAAHAASMELLLRQPSSAEGYFEGLNLGSEKGFTVKEVISMTEVVTGQKIQLIERPRRPGDPAQLVADSSRAKDSLRFKSQEEQLRQMISTAWEWEKKRMSTPRKAVFLDRDGTINVDPGYLRSPEQLHLLPQVGPALAKLREAGFLLIVVSNQSGVARGLVLESDLVKIHSRLEEMLQPWNVRIDQYALCLHHPDECCECRKPKPKLLKESALQLGIDLKNSFMVGDKISDLEAGLAAGCKGSILVLTGEGKKALEDSQSSLATFKAETLLDAAGWILSQGTVNS